MKYNSTTIDWRAEEIVTEQQNMDPVWRQTAPEGDNYAELEGKARAEVIVVGAGFCGLSAALHLVEAGRTVALIDSHEPGWGASGRNGGQVIPGLKIDPEQMTAHFGPDHAEAVISATGAAPDLVFELIDRYSIQCSPRRTGWIQLAAGPNGMREIQDRVHQLQKRQVDIDLLDCDSAFQATGALGYAGGLLDRRGGNLNPLAYARGLASALTSHKNARIFARSPATSVKQIKGKWVVETRSGQLTATRLLLCTNGYTDGCWPRLAHTVIPFVSGAVATEPLSASLRDAILSGGQAVADNCRLLSWFGLDPEGRLIFGGRTGAWSETSDPADFRNRVRRMHKVFPQVKDAAVSHHWSGLVALTADHVPHVHRLAANLYTALGFNGRGVAMATLAGKLLALLVEEGEDKAVIPLSQPRPIPLHAYRRPAVQSAVLWKKFLDRFSP